MKESELKHNTVLVLQEFSKYFPQPSHISINRELLEKQILRSYLWHPSVTAQQPVFKQLLLVILMYPKVWEPLIYTLKTDFHEPLTVFSFSGMSYKLAQIWFKSKVGI